MLLLFFTFDGAADPTASRTIALARSLTIAPNTAPVTSTAACSRSLTCLAMISSSSLSLSWPSLSASESDPLPPSPLLNTSGGARNGGRYTGEMKPTPDRDVQHAETSSQTRLLCLFSSAGRCFPASANCTVGPSHRSRYTVASHG